MRDDVLFLKGLTHQMIRNFMRHLAGAAMVLLATSMVLVGCDSQHKGEEKMKFIQVQKVLIDSGLAKQEQDYLKAVHESLQKALQLAEKNYSGMPADKRSAARQADRNIISRQWKLRKQAARNVVMSSLAKVAEAYRSENDIDVIMPMQAAIAVAPGLDTSVELTEQLKNTKLDFGKLPEVTMETTKQAAK